MGVLHQFKGRRFFTSQGTQQEIFTMRILNRKLITYLLAIMLATSNMAFVSSAYARDYESATERPSGGAMLADAVFMRVPMTLVTIAGAAVFVVTLPFSALGGNVGEAGKKLVGEPFEYAWVRPLGEM
jgi:formate/nitrite transporter FocA (FNT family)